MSTTSLTELAKPVVPSVMDSLRDKVSVVSGAAPSMGLAYTNSWIALGATVGMRAATPALAESA